MTLRSTEAVRASTVKRILIVGSLGGTLAGMMMAAVEMLYGWASDTRTFWDAPMAIWSWVAGLEHFGTPVNHVWPILLGTGGHMANAMLAGVVFATVVTALRPRGDLAPIMIGIGYGLGLWAIMRYGILPLNAGEGDLFTTNLVSPQWVWWLAHGVLGMTAGLVYDVARRIPAAPTAEQRPALRAAA